MPYFGNALRIGGNSLTHGIVKCLELNGAATGIYLHEWIVERSGIYVDRRNVFRCLQRVLEDALVYEASVELWELTEHGEEVAPKLPEFKGYREGWTYDGTQVGDWIIP